MIAGRLTDFIGVYRPTETSDGFGSSIVTWTFCRSIRAEVRFKGGRMSNEASELFSENGLEVWVRDAHRVQPHWRIYFKGDYYTVNAVEHGRLKGYNRLICDKVNQ